MIKVLLAGATALAIAGTTLAYAQQDSQTKPDVREHSRWQFSADDAQAMADARIAALKEGLKLTPDQEKNWPALETALRDMAKERIDRMNERRQQRAERREERKAEGADKKPAARDTIERLRKHADRLGSRAESYKKLADAAEPLYDSLDEGQKRRFAMLTRTLRPGAMHHHRGHRGRH
jgi:hypothetical protein